MRIYKKSLVISCIIFGSLFTIYGILAISSQSSMPIAIVSSESMYPVLTRGDIVFIKNIDPSEITNGTDGNIIVFNARGYMSYNNEYIVHRAIGKVYNTTDNLYYFHTKGDNNLDADYKWIPETQVCGVVVGILPLVGWIALFFQNINVIVCLIMICVFALLIPTSYTKKQEIIALNEYCCTHPQDFKCQFYDFKFLK